VTRMGESANMILRTFVAGMLLVLMSGCTSMAPVYSPSVSNVESASRLGSSIAVGTFEFKKGEESRLNSIGARADSFTSPTNGSYAEYVADAVRSDLRGAGKLDPASPKVLTGVLEKNELSAAGINVNNAEISVRFKLVEGGATRFEKTVSTRNEWESSLLGAIAIPRAIQNYVATVQKLVGQLFSDPDFKSSLERK
jgi:hypothetical protein